MQKYIGQIVEIIYVDRFGRFTQRKIEVHSIEGGSVKAYCLEQQAPRVFRIDNILAVQPIRKGALIHG